MRSYTFEIVEQKEILQLLYSREKDVDGNLPTAASVAKEFNRLHNKRIRTRDVERLIERFEIFGVCTAKHQNERNAIRQTVTEQVRQQVHDFYTAEGNQNISLRQAARILGMHHTTVYR